MKSLFILYLVIELVKGCGEGQMGGSGLIGCQDCGTGTFLKDNECVKCPSGSHTDEARQEECVECPAGTFSSETGSTNCETCSEGWFSEAGAAVCKECAPGSYSDTPGSTTCTPCPEGFTSESGSRSPADCRSIAQPTPAASLEPPLPNIDPNEPHEMNYRHITGLVFAGLGFGVIILMVLYMIYWRHQRLSYDRQLGTLSAARSVAVGSQEMGALNPELKCGGYNSCRGDLASPVTMETSDDVTSPHLRYQSPISSCPTVTDRDIDEALSQSD